MKSQKRQALKRFTKKIFSSSKIYLIQMDNDNSSASMIDFDLNQEPSQTLGDSLSYLLSELEDYHSRIEERIRQLEAVTARARQRQFGTAFSQYLPHPSTSYRTPTSLPSTDASSFLLPGERMAGTNGLDGVSNGTYHVSDLSSVACTHKSSDGDGHRCTQLIAKALASESPPIQKVPNNKDGSYFDCHICFSIAKDPILTCCGHLFCWPCFYRLPFISSATARECPVCKGEVTDDNITPIYGNDSGSLVHPDRSFEECGYNVPLRPHAHRIESMRQRQFISTTVPSLLTQERVRQIMATMQAVTDRTTALSSRLTYQAVPSAQPQANDSPNIQAHRLSRLLSSQITQNPLASPSSELVSSDRLVESFETFHGRQQVSRSLLQPYLADDRDMFSTNSTHDAHSVNRRGNQTAEMSSRQNGTAVQLENQLADADSPSNLTIAPHLPPSRRRNRRDHGASPEPRRRRLGD